LLSAILGVGLVAGVVEAVLFVDDPGAGSAGAASPGTACASGGVAADWDGAASAAGAAGAAGATGAMMDAGGCTLVADGTVDAVGAVVQLVSTRPIPDKTQQRANAFPVPGMARRGIAE